MAMATGAIAISTGQRKFELYGGDGSESDSMSDESSGESSGEAEEVAGVFVYNKWFYGF